MARWVLGAGAFTIVLAGCAAAGATSLDPNDDLHCFALATGFSGHAQATNAPRDQQRAAAGLVSWYGGKFDKLLQARGKESVLGEATLVAKLMDADPLAAKTAYAACLERAVADPSLDSFAARYRR